ncbi:MAG: hypothetical protein Q9191_004974 [Dirinaria sp. TL-2023a]
MDEEQWPVDELNRCLRTLTILFPRIQPEVFRELLLPYIGRSQLEIVTEWLLKDQDKYVRGRWRPPGGTGNPVGQSSELRVPRQDEFRSEGYRKAVKAALRKEFKGLSKSSIDAVLAEKNHCYTLARPTLQEIAAKSWRYSISTFFARWNKYPRAAQEEHPMLIKVKESEQTTPTFRLKESGNVELDHELYLTVLAPVLEKARTTQAAIDWELSLCVNEMEAQDARAFYECECCFSDTTFEQMATCTAGSHVICFHCLRHAVNEAIFGQGWGKNIDHDQARIKCIAPTAGESCNGCVPQAIVKRAIIQDKGGPDIWKTLENRLTSEALFKAQIPLIHCPFCSYAELDDLYLPPSFIKYKLNLSQPLTTLFLTFLTINFLPLLFLYSLLCHYITAFKLPTLSALIATSLIHLTRRKHLSARFQCRSPSCSKASCLHCHKEWHDPHKCYESATLSLRTTIEAARTAALKRTCPRCGLGFIKENGCNKMTCVCGYVMCYICRQGLLAKGAAAAGPEGVRGVYEHFCQHFRPAGGGRCAQCEKCDLYKSEDEEGVVKRAGELAEREWREREGMVGVGGIGGGLEQGNAWWEEQWTVQGVVDWWVQGLVTC